jgi:hypothetical protein
VKNDCWAEIAFASKGCKIESFQAQPYSGLQMGINCSIEPCANDFVGAI